jgi:hypothetical protein
MFIYLLLIIRYLPRNIFLIGISAKQFIILPELDKSF